MTRLRGAALRSKLRKQLAAELEPYGIPVELYTVFELECDDSRITFWAAFVRPDNGRRIESSTLWLADNGDILQGGMSELA